MTFTSSRGMALALTILLSATLPLAAQQTGITGRVTDPSGATVQNVAVTASGEDGSKTSSTTNTEGLYQLPALRAQSYVVRLDATGFAPAERSLTLLVGTTANVDVQLQVASSAS